MKLVFVLCLCGLGWVVQAQEARIYWATETDIRSTALDGSDTVILRSGLSGITAFDMLPGSNNYYYGAYQPGVGSAVYRGNTQTPAHDLIVADIPGVVFDFAFDPLRGHLYWTQWDYGLSQNNGLYRADLDGQGRVQIDPRLYPGVAVDGEAGKIYAAKLPDTVNAGQYPNDLVSLDLDGNNETLLRSLFSLYYRDIRYHSAENKLYLTFQAIDTFLLERMNPDGSGFESVPVPEMGPFDFGPTGKLFGAHYDYEDFSYDLISVNTDGSALTLLLADTPTITGLAVRAVAPTVPVLSSAGLLALLVLTAAAGLWWGRHHRRGTDPSRG